MKNFWRILILAVLGALGFWLWTVFFPNDEKLIRKHLADAARAASFSGSPSPLAQLGSVAELSTFFSPDVELDFEVPRRGHFTLQGRGEIMAVATRVRNETSALKVDFLDVTVKLGEDRESATAVLTARAQVPGERDFSVQEMKITLKKTKRRWFIHRVETVKTLSVAPQFESATAS
jgi:cytoskeletal protein RodZ